MKRIYLRPETSVIEMETVTLMAESTPSVGWGEGQKNAGEFDTHKDNDWNIWD